MRRRHSITVVITVLITILGLAPGLFVTLPVSDAIDTTASKVAWRVPANIGTLSFISPARGQPAALPTSQSDALAAYNKAVNDFKSIEGDRRARRPLQPAPRPAACASAWLYAAGLCLPTSRMLRMS